MKKYIQCRKKLIIGLLVFLLNMTIVPITESVILDKEQALLTERCSDGIILNGTMGDNGWYISPVTITFTNENGSWVHLFVLIDGGDWFEYTGPIVVDAEGTHTVKWYYVDQWGNQSAIMTAPPFRIDMTKPTIILSYTVEGNLFCGFDIIFNASAIDKMSGMNRVEFYYNEILQETIFGSGPDYIWLSFCPQLTVRGFILHLEITDEYVKFYSVMVRIKNLWDWMNNAVIKAVAYDNAGNWDWDEIENPCHPAVIEHGLYLFQNVTLPNNYDGHIGSFFIKATFWVG
jgi:hypothetical protein